MAIEIHQFSANIPAGTLKSAPVIVPMALGLYEIESIGLYVPAGPSGLMGFFLAVSGQQWLPWETGQFFIWDDIDKEWPVTKQPTSSSWEVHGYNTGKYAHRVDVKFHVNNSGPVAAAPVPQITIIQSHPSLSTSVL